MLIRDSTVITRASGFRAEELFAALAAESGVTALQRDVDTLSSAACTAHGPTNPVAQTNGWRRLHTAVGRTMWAGYIRAMYMCEGPRPVMCVNVEYRKMGGDRVLYFFIHLQTI